MEKLFLKIENPGVSEKTDWTLLGASTKRSGVAGGTIGSFGSGNKFGTILCLRNDLPPIVYAGNLKMTFGTEKKFVRGKELDQVFIKYSGKEGETNRSGTEMLGWVLDYGAQDWDSIDLALREYVSNAIDAAIEEVRLEYGYKYQRDTNTKCSDWTPEQYEVYWAAQNEYMATQTPWDNVKIEVVPENQVRAKAGHTRVFVPMNEKIYKFYNNIGKWFLHFSEPENLNKTVLPKKNRNLGDRKSAVIFRRGVRVREVENNPVESLFDYNLNNLRVDESRKVDDYVVKAAAAKVVRDAEKPEIMQLINCFWTQRKVWEYEFDSYNLTPDYTDTDEKLKHRQRIWNEAMNAVVGEDSVIATAGNGETAKRKGYKVITAPEAFVKAAGAFEMRTPEKILSQDDREGREIVEPTLEAITALDMIWNLVVNVGMTNGKEKPALKCFTKIMEAGCTVQGFYRDNTVFINTDIAGNNPTKELTQTLKAVMLEEIGHYVTGACDFVRDFQDYFINLAIKIYDSK